MLKKLLLVLFGFLSPLARENLYRTPEAPDWMQEQIQHDLAPFRGKALSISKMREFYRGEEFPQLIILEVQIQNNKVKCFPSKEMRTSSLNEWYKVLRSSFREIAKKNPLPDCTFFVFVIDGYTRNVPFPVFVFDSLKNAEGTILIPDTFNLDRKYNVVSILQHPPRWEEKIEKLLWRGSTQQYLLPQSGKRGREILCELSQENPQLIDAGFTLSYQQDLPEHQNLLRKYGKERIPYQELVLGKYQLWIDGCTASYTDSGWRFFSHSVVLKPDSEYIQWYYQALRPFVHYIPVVADLSDLVEKIEWLKANDSIAQEVAKNALEFGKTHITREKSLEYLTYLLWEYSKLEFVP